MEVSYAIGLLEKLDDPDSEGSDYISFMCVCFKLKISYKNC